jgi:hypothetical protein
MKSACATEIDYLESMLGCSVSGDRKAFDKMYAEYTALVMEQYGKKHPRTQILLRERDNLSMSFTARFAEDRDFFRFLTWKFLYWENGPLEIEACRQVKLLQSKYSSKSPLCQEE